MASFNYARSELLFLGCVCLADNVLNRLTGSTFTIAKSLGLLRAGRGCRAGRLYQLKTIKQKSKIDSWISDGRRYANFGQIGRSPETTRTKRTLVNLINITSTTSELTKKQVPGFQLNFCLLNARSADNKISEIKDYTIDKDVDLFAIDPFQK